MAFVVSNKLGRAGRVAAVVLVAGGRPDGGMLTVACVRETGHHTVWLAYLQAMLMAW